MLSESQPAYTTRLLGDGEWASFDNAVARSWHGCWLQSTLWGEFKARFAWEPHRLLLEDGAGIAGGALLLRRRLPAGLSLLYAPRGPFLRDPDERALRALLDGVRRTARELQSPVVKMDPEWPEDEHRTRALLDTARLRRGGRDVQHRATMVLDIDGPEDALMHRLKSICRYSIRYAERHGVEVETRDDASAMDAFLPLLDETAARQNFVARAPHYYRTLAQVLAPGGHLRVHLARVGGDVVGGAVMVHFGRKLHYLFGGSRPMHQQLKPNYLVHWRAIQEARRAGLTEYDMWGVPYAPREGERGWGYYVFKSKFNARHVRFPGMLEMRTSAILGGALRVAESLVRRSEPEFA